MNVVLVRLCMILKIITNFFLLESLSIAMQLFFSGMGGDLVDYEGKQLDNVPHLSILQEETHDKYLR